MSAVQLHLLLNHVPVIGIVFTLALLAVALLRKSSEIGKLALSFLILLGVAAVAVFLTGEPAEELVEGLPGVSEPLLERHEELASFAMVAMAALGVAAAGALAFTRRRTLPRPLMAGAFAATLGVAGVAGATANVGGQIRHSEIRPEGLASSAATKAVGGMNAQQSTCMAGMSGMSGTTGMRAMPGMPGTMDSTRAGTGHDAMQCGQRLANDACSLCASDSMRPHMMPHERNTPDPAVP